MKIILPSSGLASILILAPILFIVSCSTVNIDNKDSKENNNAIARVYIGLNSSKLQREIDIEEVEEIISKYFSASTLQQSTGFYKGEREMSLIITIINCCTWEEAEEKFRIKIINLVSQLRSNLGQESILVEYLSDEETEAFEVLE